MSRVSDGECCLICGRRDSVEDAHWPRAIGMGRKRKQVGPLLPSLPLCSDCHRAQHYGQVDVVERLIELAPRYWKRTGEWEQAREVYEAWLSRRRLVTGAA